LGYVDNPTAYKILDITNNKIIISRNVEFFEFTPGNSHLSYCDNDISNFIPNNIIRKNNNTYFYDNTYDINQAKTSIILTIIIRIINIITISQIVFKY